MPDNTWALCGGPGRSGGLDWAALSMQKGTEEENPISDPVATHQPPMGEVNPL